jgi:hypothetical protein
MNDLAIHDSAIVKTQDPLVSFIERAATDPSFDVDKLERMFAMKERMDAQHRKELFDAALLRVQKAAPRIRKDGLMDRGPGKGQISFARREDIDAVMRPIYQAEGFSVTWNSPMGPDGKIRVIGRFSAHGHTEEREWSCSPDTSGGKQNPQAAGSTVSYGQRYLSKMFWDVIEEGEDTNGAPRKDVEPISMNQALDIVTRMNDLPQKTPGVLLSKLCAKYGVNKPEDLRVSQWADVLKDVEITERMRAGQ